LPLQPWLRRSILAGAVGVGLVLLALTMQIFAPLLTSATVARSMEARAMVPAYEYEPWYSLAIQDGRTKPFQSACGEAVRKVTGRSRFEGLDPVAVVLAWMLAEGNGTDHGTCWENYPFILCAHRELRRQIYEHLPEEQRDAIQETSQYITPADLRASPGFDRLLQTVARTRRDIGGKAHLELTTEYLKAEEVGRRLMLFDTLCGKTATRLFRNALAGEQFLDLQEYADIEDCSPDEALARLEGKLTKLADPLHLVPLDRVAGSGWFSLAELRAMRRDSSQWGRYVARRLREMPERYLGPEGKQALDALGERLQSGNGRSSLEEVKAALTERREARLRRLESADRAGNRDEANRLFQELLPTSQDQLRFQEARARFAKGPQALTPPVVEELRAIARDADERVLRRLDEELQRAQQKVLDDAELRMIQLDYLESLFPDLYREALKDQEYPQAQVDAVLTAFQKVRDAYRTGTPARFDEASQAFFHVVATAGEAVEPYPGVETISAELLFNRLQPFLWSWIAMLAALILLGISLIRPPEAHSGKRLWYGLGLALYVASLAMQAIGFGLRIAISGRAPVSNMYETVIFVAFMSALFALILELIYRRRVIAVAGAAVATLGLVLADQMPLALDPKISPMVPVLRTNYWLTVHVLTIVSSYAAGTLAWGLGNVTLALLVFGKGQPETLKTLAHYTYRALQIAVLLLAAGTFLGGWWAAESWGRFWGWDPKEVGALIALVCYVIPLHARYLGWIRDFGLAVSAILCYASILLSWYVVNFVVAAGLHSYGFGAGGAVWVLWASLLNIEWVLIATYLVDRRSSGARDRPAEAAA
jgi:ABC-type transport system involved in cytochrome c biogenesis permease subunit